MAESTIITGQFVRISQTPASIGERLIALVIDYILLGFYVFSTLALFSRIHLPSDFTMLFFLAIVYLPVLFLSRLPVLPGLFSLVVGLRSTLLLTSLRTTVSTLFLSLVTAVVAVLATVAVTATLAFPVAVKASETLLFQQVPVSYTHLTLPTNSRV